MRESTVELATDDQWPTTATVWEGEADVKGIVQIAHGAAEHRLRYRRFAEALTGAGFVVGASDHRGHGDSTNAKGALGVAGADGWNAILSDTRSFSRQLTARYPGCPLVLFGHSMGAMVAQQYLARWGGDLSGAIISGSAVGSAGRGDFLAVLDAAVADGGPEAPSELWASIFDRFNDRWSGEGATGYEWLSRDADEVQKYVENRFCGHTLSNGLVRDMLTALNAHWTDDAISLTPPDVSIFIVSGSDDPIGGEGGSLVAALGDRYVAAGCADVTVRLYEGGRHELLNEINRGDVQDDVLAWLSRVLG